MLPTGIVDAFEFYKYKCKWNFLKTFQDSLLKYQNIKYSKKNSTSKTICVKHGGFCFLKLHWRQPFLL